MSYQVDVVFPCLNEASALPALLGSLPVGFRAIVVDNGSTDDSAHIARLAGAQVVTESRRGYGAAVRAGLAVATADIVIVSDTDGTIDPAQFEALIEPLLVGAADLTIARRHPTTNKAWPLTSQLANKVLAGMLSRRSGMTLTDLGPARASHRIALLALGVRDERSGYPVELFLRAVYAGWTIEQVDMKYAPRIGHSKVTGTLRGFVTAVADMRRQMRAVTR